MIWDRIYTQQDIVISEKLVSIIERLTGYFKESGIVTFEWNGDFVQSSISDWTFEQPVESELKAREAEIQSWYKNWNSE